MFGLLLGQIFCQVLKVLTPLLEFPVSINVAEAASSQDSLPKPGTKLSFSSEQQKELLRLQMQSLLYHHKVSHSYSQ